MGTRSRPPKVQPLFTQFNSLSLDILGGVCICTHVQMRKIQIQNFNSYCSYSKIQNISTGCPTHPTKLMLIKKKKKQVYS